MNHSFLSSKPSTRKKLVNYSTAALSFFAIQQQASAQTIDYQDPEIPSNGCYYFEFGDDPSWDIGRCEYSTSYWIPGYSGYPGTLSTFCYVYLTGGMGMGILRGVGGAKQLSAGFPIGPSASPFSPYTCFIEWTPDTVQYFGFYNENGGQKYYGWMRASYHEESIDRSSSGTVECPIFEIYDYAIHTIPNQPILAGQYCEPPENLMSDVSGVNVKLSWDPFDQATHYTVKYRKVGSTVPNTLVTTDTEVTLVGLLANTDYEWFVISHIGSDIVSHPSDIANFATVLGPKPKPKPRYDDTF